MHTHIEAPALMGFLTHELMPDKGIIYGWGGKPHRFGCSRTACQHRPLLVTGRLCPTHPAVLPRMLVGKTGRGCLHCSQEQIKMVTKQRAGGLCPPSSSRVRTLPWAKFTVHRVLVPKVRPPATDSQSFRLSDCCSSNFLPGKLTSGFPSWAQS